MNGATSRATGRLTFVSDADGSTDDPTGHAGDDVDDIMARVAQGDDSAFATLYDRTSAKVFGLVKRVVRDPAQAEEVSQEVYLQVWRQAGRFDRAAGSGLAWVLTLAHRRAVDRVRSSQAAADRDVRAAERDLVPVHDQVAEAVEERLEAEQVRRCLERLTQLQRESVTLAYYQGFTYAEVGATLGVPLGTVKSRMRDGLVRLRDCMGVPA
jgi:RNA polymerase sigma-70 factor (ECF subfamily)